jgi:hypothetical protein
MDKYICSDLLKYIICDYLPHTIHSYDGCITYPVNKYFKIITSFDDKRFYIDDLLIYKDFYIKFHHQNSDISSTTKYNYVSKIRREYSNKYGVIEKNYYKADKKIKYITINNNLDCSNYNKQIGILNNLGQWININQYYKNNKYIKANMWIGEQLQYNKEWYSNGTLKLYQLLSTTIYEFYENGKLKSTKTVISDETHYTYYKYNDLNLVQIGILIITDSTYDNDLCAINYKLYNYKHNVFVNLEAGDTEIFKYNIEKTLTHLIEN